MSIVWIYNIYIDDSFAVTKSHIFSLSIEANYLHTAPISALS